MLDAMVGFLGKNAMTAYLCMMGVRLTELHRVLKPTGSLYLHCDPTASHYLKVLLDAVFGPTIAVGLGGIFTEVLRDITYRIAPFDTEEAHVMLDELRARALFDGVRGGPELDVNALAEALSALSRLAWEHRDRLAELDVNPLFVRPKGQGIVAADALVVLK